MRVFTLFVALASNAAAFKLTQMRTSVPTMRMSEADAKIIKPMMPYSR